MFWSKLSGCASGKQQTKQDVSMLAFRPNWLERDISLLDSRIARSGPAAAANFILTSMALIGGKEAMFNPMQGDVGADGEHRRQHGPAQMALAGEYADGRGAP